MEAVTSDLHVTPISDALKGRRIDVVVSGSIAAVEGVRFIRSLRRLGATVTPWLTQGGSQFVTPMALEWAADQTCVNGFSGTATHICTSDAVIIAPASSSFIARIAGGQTDTPTSALVSSALGQKKPVLILPAMHDSLAQAPSNLAHLKTIESWPGVKILMSRQEEGKRKFPEPAILADQIAHHLNLACRPALPVLITMGTTRGYIDDVRYVSNYSSGKLGSEISEELYRQGFQTHVVCGPCEHKPKLTSILTPVRTTNEMLEACINADQAGAHAGIFCASVLDYEPEMKIPGKIQSGQTQLQINMKPTPKIIEQVQLSGRVKIGFKLETNLTLDRAKAIAADYTKRYDLRALIANDLNAVSATTHAAWAITRDGSSAQLQSKKEIAAYITQLLVP